MYLLLYAPFWFRLRVRGSTGDGGATHERMPLRGRNPAQEVHPALRAGAGCPRRIAVQDCERLPVSHAHQEGGNEAQNGRVR
jgi:hypothetical protein